MPDDVSLGSDGRGYLRGRRKEERASHGVGIKLDGARDALLHDHPWLFQQLLACLQGHKARMGGTDAIGAHLRG